MKGGCIIFILILLISNFIVALNEGIVSNANEQGITPSDPEEIPQEQVNDDGSPPETLEINYEEETPTLVIEEETSVELQGTTSPDYNWETPQGTIADFSLTNALFSLGSLIQGSFISFENNNNIFFSSLFDSSEFIATLDEEGELNVGQRNGNGDLGRVYITIENGNLTQDEYVVFIPEGNEPTYIYYNTTEIEFKDGNVTLLGETISNNDDSNEKTKVQFNENGFTKIELPMENIYTIDDYSIQNKEVEPLIICKKDPLCDVNIDEESFTIKGKIAFTEKNELLFESLDANNEIVLDISNKSIIFFNGNPKEEILLTTNLQSHRITETKENIYEYPIANGIKYFSYESKLHNKVLDLRDNLVHNNFIAFENTFENYLPAITGSVLGGFESDLGLSLILFSILIGLLVFVQYKRRAQMSIMILFGLALLLIIGLILYFSMDSNNSFESMTEIESLEQAQDAVEECEEGIIKESIALLGMHSGYIEESFSDFGTAYELIPKESMEENLREYLEEELRECGSILAGTKFSFEAERFVVEVSLEEEIIVKAASIGKIKNSNTINVNEINEQYSINYNEILLIVEELMNSVHGIPINSYEGYEIESFVNDDLTERLIVVRDETGFEFRITKELN